MNQEDLVQAGNALMARLQDGPVDVGADAEEFHPVVEACRKAGHVIAVGCRHKESTGKYVQFIGLGQDGSSKISVSLMDTIEEDSDEH